MEEEKGPPVAGVLLAGGLARRMGGGDKALLTLAGESMLARVVARARPQVSVLLLNANGDPARFSAFGLPVTADGVDGYPGPLAGVLAGLDWTRLHRPDIAWVASFATDTPLLPVDLVSRLRAALEGEAADIACARSKDTLHPVFALWPVRLAEELRRALVEEGIRKVERWMRRYRLAVVSWPGDGADPFTNVNTPEDLERLRHHLTVSGQKPYPDCG